MAEPASAQILPQMARPDLAKIAACWSAPLDSPMNPAEPGRASFWHHRRRMSDKVARRHAISEWLLEFSVLWAVFPLLDQLVQRDTLDWELLGISAGISLTTGSVGLMMITKGNQS
jgi:hypothetical protein